MQTQLAVQLFYCMLANLIGIPRWFLDNPLKSSCRVISHHHCLCNVTIIVMICYVCVAISSSSTEMADPTRHDHSWRTWGNRNSKCSQAWQTNLNSQTHSYQATLARQPWPHSFEFTRYVFWAIQWGRKTVLGVMSVTMLCATTAVSVFVNMSPKLAVLVNLLWADNDEWCFY